MHYALVLPHATTDNNRLGGKAEEAIARTKSANPLLTCATENSLLERIVTVPNPDEKSLLEHEVVNEDGNVGNKMDRTSAFTQFVPNSCLSERCAADGTIIHDGIRHVGSGSKSTATLGEYVFLEIAQKSSEKSDSATDDHYTRNFLFYTSNIYFFIVRIYYHILPSTYCR